MKFRALAIGATALFLPFAVACGDDGGGGKPSQSDVSKSLQDNASMPKKQADCIAKELDGKVPDKVLRAIADDNEGNISDDEEKKATEAITKAVTSCVGEVPTPDGVTVPTVTVPQ